MFDSSGVDISQVARRAPEECRMGRMGQGQAAQGRALVPGVSCCGGVGEWIETPHFDHHSHVYLHFKGWYLLIDICFGYSED